ncbi:actin [Plakobranchus ocellatus]|uniref:Actin n=1 Tax=Plakobranchus ocellatus TaxID=259542 RepID=A0AAV4AP07_9GAST|nr:actin [Plakobranchus ocellatus]
MGSPMAYSRYRPNIGCCDVTVQVPAAMLRAMLAIYLGFEPMLSFCQLVVIKGHFSTLVRDTPRWHLFGSHSPFHAVSRHDFGGKDLTLYLRQLLHQIGYSFTTTSELRIVREIKERFCCIPQFVSIQNVGCSVPRGEKKFKLPDGTYG